MAINVKLVQYSDRPIQLRYKRPQTGHEERLSTGM